MSTLSGVAHTVIRDIAAKHGYQVVRQDHYNCTMIDTSNTSSRPLIIPTRGGVLSLDAFNALLRSASPALRNALQSLSAPAPAGSQP